MQFDKVQKALIEQDYTALSIDKRDY